MSWSRQLGPRTQMGAFGFLSANQSMIGGVGVVATLTVLSQLAGSPWGLPAAIVLACATGFVVFAPRWGMPLANWAVKAVAYKTGSKRWHARPVGRQAEQLPRELEGVGIELVPVRERSVLAGMLRDGRALVGVARLDLHSLGLLDLDEHARHWGSCERILDDLAHGTHDDSEYRVQLLSKHTPRRANGVRDYVQASMSAEKAGTPQAASMLQVIDHSEKTSHDDEFYVAIRQSSRNQQEAAARLIERLRNLMERLERAEIAIRTTRQPLEPRQLARLIKDSFDPFDKHVRDQLERATGTTGVDPAAAWPDWCVRHVDCYQTDSGWHATLWARGWPNKPVAPGWLTPLTLRCNVPAMTVSTVMATENPGRAKKALERKANRTGSLTMVRSKHGQAERVEHETRDQFLKRQEGELAGGATPWRWETYITVSAPTREQLDESVRKVESACVECGLVPVLLRWAQAQSFTFTLPLGRGLEPEKARL